MTKGLPELKTIYALTGAPDAVAGQTFDFPHNDNQVSREYAYAWFNRVFKLGLPEPVRERPFVPVPPAQLHVFDASHPRPPSERDAGRARALTDLSDRRRRSRPRRTRSTRSSAAASRRRSRIACWRASIRRRAAKACRATAWQHQPC
jgi:hypothetical protein